MTYVSSVLWEKEQNQTFLNVDNMEHVQWVHTHALERAQAFHIEPFSLEITSVKKLLLSHSQLILHNVVVTLPTTNAIIASLMCSLLRRIVEKEMIDKNYIM